VRSQGEVMQGGAGASTFGRLKTGAPIQLRFSSGASGMLTPVSAGAGVAETNASGAAGTWALNLCAVGTWMHARDADVLHVSSS
jgi:hypothetical protein